MLYPYGLIVVLLSTRRSLHVTLVKILLPKKKKKNYNLLDPASSRTLGAHDRIYTMANDGQSSSSTGKRENI